MLDTIYALFYVYICKYVLTPKILCIVYLFTLFESASLVNNVHRLALNNA